MSSKTVTDQCIPISILFCRCVVYEYPDLQKFPTVTGENGFVIDRNGSQIPTQVFPNQIVLDELGIPTLAQIDNAQVCTQLLKSVVANHQKKFKAKQKCHPLNLRINCTFHEILTFAIYTITERSEP